MKLVKTFNIENLQVEEMEELDDSQALAIVGGSEALKVLNNIRTLRSQAREGTLETLEKMLEKLETVVNERREEDLQSI